MPRFSPMPVLNRRALSQDAERTLIDQWSIAQKNCEKRSLLYNRRRKRYKQSHHDEEDHVENTAAHLPRISNRDSKYVEHLISN